MQNYQHQPHQNLVSPESTARMQQDLNHTVHKNSRSPDSLDDEEEISPGMLKRVLPQGRKLRVGIVGAGVAGLRAADVLLQQGVNVTTFEARERVGGRLVQAEVGGYTVDLGPNWIHGNNPINPMTRLAHETNTTTCSIGEAEALLDTSTNIRISPPLASEIQQTFWGIISDAFKHSNEHTSTIPSSTSLMDFVREQAKGKFVDDDECKTEAEKEEKRELLLKEAEMWGAFVGSPVTRQSLKFFWLEECIEGENPFVAGTYSKILGRLARPVFEGAEMRLGVKVEGVFWSEGGDGNDEVRLKVEGGGAQEEVFDEVIVTSPLGWLKRNKSFFHPPLPERLEQAIDNIGYGTLDKVYLTFPKAFWDNEPAPAQQEEEETEMQNENKATSLSTHNHDSVPNTTATIAPPHQPSTTTPSQERQYPGSMHWLSSSTPSTTTTTTSSPTSMQAISLSRLPHPHKHPTLLFYIFGPTATHISTLLTSSPSKTHLSLLTSYFTPYISLLPNYSPTSPCGHPIAALATNWAADEMAGYGSYSNFQIGAEEADKDVEVMRHGMPERRVWLAGEHTSPFVALGTVTGAYWAGQGVSERLLRGYGIDVGGGDGGMEGV